MSAVAVAGAIHPPDRRLAPIVAVVEARRLLRHPVMVAGFAAWLVLAGDEVVRGVSVVGSW